MAATTRCRLLTICTISAILLVNGTKASKEVMTKLSKGFAKVINKCNSELGAEANLIEDFWNFWREDYELLNRDFGCLLLCVVSKLDLISDDTMTMHHGKAHDFAKAHGADDTIAKQLVTMVHDCETATVENSDDCFRMLQVSKCFRTKIHDLKWAPSIEVVLEEIMVAA